MTMVLWPRLFLCTVVAISPVCAETRLDSKGVNGDKNSVFQNKESRKDLEPLQEYLDSSRQNSRYPSDPFNPPKPFYNPSPFFSYHVEEIAPNKPRPYLRPAPIIINNHRPHQTHHRPSASISNHSPYSTIRPLPTNQPDVIRNITFGLAYPQMHVVPSGSHQNNQNLVSSNSIDFIHKHTQDTTVVYSDVIVLKKPFGDGGEEPASLTIFTSRNDSSSQVEVSTNLPESTSPLLFAEELNSTENKLVDTEITTTLQPDTTTEEVVYNSDLINFEESVHRPTSISAAAGSTHLTSFRPPSLTPSNSLTARPLAQRLLIAIPGTLLALGLLVLIVLL